MSWTPQFVTTKDAGNVVINLPVITAAGQLQVPMHSLASPIASFSATNVTLAGQVSPTPTTVPPASSADFLQITGSATKTVGIMKIDVSSLPGAPSPGSVLVSIARHTAPWTPGAGGVTSLVSSLTTIPAAPAYATPNAPTVAIDVPTTTAPTSSLTGGVISTGVLFFPGPSGKADTLTWEFGTRGQQPLIVSGTGDYVVLSFLSPTTAPANMLINIEWIEF